MRNSGLAAATVLCSFAVTSLAAAQTPPKYIVTLGNMTVWNGVAHAIDTDYITLQVEGPNGQKFVKTFGPNNLHKGQTTDWALSSDPITVPNDAASSLKITWAAVNKGTTTQQKIADPLAKAVTKIGEGDPNPFVAIGSFLADAGLSFVLADCDAPLFAGTLIYDGTTMADLGGKGHWPVEGANRWHNVWDYPNIQSSCDTGHYNQEIHITRQ